MFSKIVFRLMPVLLLVMVIGCARPKKPEFVRVKSLEIKEFTENKVSLSGEAILNNPNSFAVTVKEIDVYATINDRAVGKVNQTGDILVPARSEFDVPLLIDFAPKDVYDNLLTGLVSVLRKGELQVHYQGVIRMKVKGIMFKIPVDHRNVVKL